MTATISKMLASQSENADDKHSSGQLAKVDKSIEQEIECPRCYDVITLYSEFDILGYLCEEWKSSNKFEYNKIQYFRFAYLYEVVIQVLKVKVITYDE